MRILLCLCLFALCISCKSKRALQGSYVHKTVDPYFYCTIDLYEDSMYTFYWRGGLNEGTDTGKWYQKGKYVILTSLIKTDSVLKVYEYQKLDKDSVYIKGLSSDGQPLAGAIVVLNDTVHAKLNFDGLATIDRGSFKTLKLYYINPIYPEYNIRDSAANYFILTAYVSLNNAELYFNQTHIKVAGEKLIIPKKKSLLPVILYLVK